MTQETNSRATPSLPSAGDASSHLKAFIHSIPEPVFPPEEDYSLALDILRAARPLFDGDRDWILPDIARLEEQLPVYDTLLDRLYTALRVLQVHRDTIQSMSKEFSSTLAPIRRLPSDVLRSVFGEIRSDLGGWRESYDRPTIKFMQDTLTLGHVCHSWRDIVVSSPELWSHFRITFPSPSRDNPGRFPILRTILPLCGQFPLDVRFLSESRNPPGEDIEAFSSLLRERHRWRSAFLQIPLDLLEQLRTSSGKLAYLESFTVMVPCQLLDDRISPPGHVSHFFMDAPSLQKVILRATDCGSFVFPCQITHLAAFFSSIHNLHSYSLLEELHLEERESDDFAFPHRITLPKVRRLSVSSLKMLRQLLLPSLEDLLFDHYFPAQGFFPHSDPQTIVDATVTICDFIRSSHCSLTSLATLTPIVYASSFVPEIVPLLESLTSLAFEIDYISERRFYDTLMSPNVLPNLQYLIMRLPPLEMEDISQDALSAMLASRGQHLSVTIRCPLMPDEKHVGILNTLQPLRQLGGDVRVELEGMGNSIGFQFGNFA
ncbi:hypothetical protein IW261DRAFT_1536146 [Armillaria novae-zelandiae]|uniref:F-box domain-containing protein n=1 Tax=Armillaria novae-zelandiae TaxID=153914 RepID=A0AA39KHI8_9AGAR|nr:hypothetical protein IW261DRAFT_1536146 [Armillaria novae-zelandiae]